MPDLPSSPKVLLVDDDHSALFIYKTHLVRAGYQVVCSPDVTSAKAVIESEGPESFSLVVTDFWMPGETGFDLLRYIRHADRTLAVIIITAEGEKDHVARSLREGAHNFLDKPVSGAVLREAAIKAIESTQKQRSLRATAQEAKALGDTQRLLLGRQTAALSGRLHLFARPHAQAGGDFAAAFAIGEQRFVVLVSDVSGHDLSAAYYSAYLQGVARGMLDRGASIQDVFGRLNRMILDEWNKGGSVELSLSACAADIDLNKKTLTALNCGLPMPYLSDMDGWATPLGETKAHPLGWFDEMPSCAEKTLSGGHLSFWSDGLEDAADRLGVAPLSLAHRLQMRSTGSEELLATISRDDIVAVRLDLSVREDAALTTRLPVLAEIIPGASHGEIDRIQAFLGKSLKVAFPALDDAVLADSLLCIREALLNALIHGCGRKPDRYAFLQAAHDIKTNMLHLSIADDGKGHFFDFDKHENVAAESLIPEHRGLVLMKNLADRMHLSARGNRLSMDFPLSTPE
ncbi:MAG: response regulator [Opitutaceae bacterium]|jgi:sigma-B regulation protein RsbU (phosphoserine phosphatase)